MLTPMPWSDVSDGLSYPLQVSDTVHTHDVSEHCHVFYEVVYVRDGFCLHTLNGETSLMMAGDMLAIRPSDTHRYRTRRNVMIVNLMFMPEALIGIMGDIRALPGMDDFFSERPSKEWHLHAHLSLPDRESAQQLLVEMQTEREGVKPGWSLRQKALLTEFMVLMSRVFAARFSHDDNAGAYESHVMRALEIVERDAVHGASVSDIAHQLGITPEHLSRLFKRIMGITPVEYIRRYRFARALELLRKGQSVSDTCANVGFNHVSHFSREFTQTFGLTPSAFRKQALDRRERKPSNDM